MIYSSALSGGLAVVMISGGGGGRYSGGGAWRPSRSPQSNPNPFKLGKFLSDTIAFAALIGPIVSVITLNFVASFALAAAIAVPTAIALACFAVVDEKKEFKGKGFALGALALGLICAALITPVCFMIHLAPFPLLGWAAEALYVLALASGVWKQLGALLKFLSLFTAVGVAAALIVLPTPAGAEAAGDDQRTWTVAVTVETTDHQPVAKAWAQCASWMKWEEARKYVMKKGVGALTGENGKASFTFNDDMRLKIAICGAQKPATDDAPGCKLSSAIVIDPLGAGPDPMDWIMRAITSRPMRGKSYPVTITLSEQTDEREEAYPAAENSSSEAAAESGGDAAPARFDESALPENLAAAVRAARQAADAARERASAADASEMQAQSDAASAREWAANAAEAETNAAAGIDGYKSYATETYSYAGQWNGARDGLGVERWRAPSPADGETYSGGFSAGARSSYGVVIYGAHNRNENGLDRYEGAWSGGARTSGVLSWSDGDSYAGGYSGDGKRAGAAVSHYDSGDVYRGDYQDDERTGYGVMTFGDGDSFAGGFAGGNRSGYGVYTFNSGERYEGQWSSGKRDGVGVQWSVEGKPERAGVWRGGEFTGAP